MRETVEFRIPETYARECLQPDEGNIVGGIARQYTVSVNDSRFFEIGRIDSEFRAQGKAFFTGWVMHRHYTPSELSTAELLLLKIPSVFEPTGEECGTVYDNSKACSYCGAGRRQMSSLRLDTTKVPRNKDIARTIADEIVVSERMYNVVKKGQVSGVELHPVERARSSGKKQPCEWWQLVVTSNAIPVADATRFGESPFDEMPTEGVCPNGHSKGLNLISELSVLRSGWDGSDINPTEQMAGYRSGLLIAAPLLLVSQRLMQLVKTEKMKGFEFEVAKIQGQPSCNRGVKSKAPIKTGRR